VYKASGFIKQHYRIYNLLITPLLYVDTQIGCLLVNDAFVTRHNLKILNHCQYVGKHKTQWIFWYLLM